jgi:lipopolysaccharide transport protein LptA
LPSEYLETSADEVSIDVKNGTQTLTGNVVVTYNGKIFNASTIVIRQIGERIQEIVATGGIVFNDDGTTATADRCMYNRKTVAFCGNVVVSNDEFGTVHASNATYDLATKKMKLTSKGVVRLTLSPSREAKIFK